MQNYTKLLENIKLKIRNTYLLQLR